MKLKFINLIVILSVTVSNAFSKTNTYNEVKSNGITSITNNKTNKTFFAPIITGELKKWHKVTISFQGPNTSETNATNPFMDYRLDVTFTNGTKTYVVPGYYAADGNAAETSATEGNVWRVHFAPDATGTWTYKVSFRTGKNVAVAGDAQSGTATSFNNETGTFEIANSDKTGRDFRGKGRLQYVGQHYLQFAETKDYFIKAGADSMENTLAYNDIDDTPNRGGKRKAWTPHQKDYDATDASAYTWNGGKGSELLGSIKYLSDQGMNVFSFLTFNLGGDDENVFPHLLKISLSSYDKLPAISGNQANREKNWNDAVHHDRFDVSKMAQWEKIFEYGDKKGMYLHFKTTETETDDLMDNANLGNERKIYYRELIARFGHHLALNWNLGEEASISVAALKSITAFIKSTDPYKHNIVIHTYPTEAEFDKYYNEMTGNKSELTGASMQIQINSIHGTIKKWVTNSSNAGKKWIVANDEQGDANSGVAVDNGYSGNLPSENKETDNRTDVKNKTLWGTLMAGGAGVEYYYGYATGCTDLDCQDHRTRETKWKDARIALEFFNNNMQSFLTGVVGNDGLTSATNDYVLAKPGAAYAIYLPSGGTTNLNLAGVTGTYNVKWFDSRNGGSLQNGTVATLNGGTNNSVGQAPKDTGKDWVVLVTNQSVLAVNDFEFTNRINISPNPIVDMLKINGLTSDDKTISIYSIIGKNVFTQTNVINSEENIDVSNLDSGIYILKTEAGKAVKFIKE